MNRSIAVRWAMATPLLGTLGALVLGCGGGGPEEATLVPEPGTRPSTSVAGGREAAPADTGAPSAAEATDEAAPTAAEGFGTIRGRVVFNGEVPEVRVLVPQGEASKDPEFCAADDPIMSDALLVNEENKGVKNALVYLRNPTDVSPEALSAAQNQEIVFDQVGCVFIPHVLPILAGSEVTVKSSDPVTHNVNVSLGTFRLNQSFSPNDSRDITLEAPSRSPGSVVCDIHSWMGAYWMVLPDPYYAVTDENGEFVIENAPAGSQNIVVWHETTDYLTSPRGDRVDVEADGEVEFEVTMESAQVDLSQ